MTEQRSPPGLYFLLSSKRDGFHFILFCKYEKYTRGCVFHTLEVQLKVLFVHQSSFSKRYLPRSLLQATAVIVAVPERKQAPDDISFSIHTQGLYCDSLFASNFIALISSLRHAQCGLIRTRLAVHDWWIFDCHLPHVPHEHYRASPRNLQNSRNHLIGEYLRSSLDEDVEGRHPTDHGRFRRVFRSRTTRYGVQCLNFSDVGLFAGRH